SSFPARPGSPTRPWTPSRGSTAGNYEPAEINGSPRPGTPSSRYGGSPRRPLPPAPLFAGPAPTSSGDDASIDIADGDENGIDVFGGGGRVADARDDARASLRSHKSYLSESTVVTDEKDSMSKVDVDDEDESD